VQGHREELGVEITFDDAVEFIGQVIDGIGIAILVTGAAAALVPYLARLIRRRATNNDYLRVRRRLGRAILLGLEFLVAADIIRTVVISPTLGSVAALGLIVLIRTFLSATLQVEIEGQWPWQREESPNEG